MLVISFLVNKPSMWSHIGFQKRGDAPLNMTPTLPSKPTSTSPSPGSVSSVSTHLWIPTEEQKEYYWLYTLGALSTRAGYYFPPLLEETSEAREIQRALCRSCLSLFLLFFFFLMSRRLWEEQSRLAVTTVSPPGIQTLLTVTDMQPLTIICVLFLLFHICCGSAATQR